ncbi:hypothetical protein PRUB_b1019 [Pseudoalteromonas rubra]|uniref:Uncharacterized protein n=1 Tax=Pseudoalteromonas rubra TaxID=43658 RepID=A0A8T0C1A0_9GAMM|nr:hypothetical protein [Pseudoalteromonas rubra]KAF7781705.1 hypothetical protein PRUB_b1019 [Pseudoalteromonas rubra]
MKIYKLRNWLVILSVFILASCLGDDDDNNNTPDQTAQTTEIKVSPALGLTKNANVRLILLATNTPIEGATGNTGETGVATITLASAITEPFIVEVLGGGDAEYFDEAKGVFLALGADTTLRAVLSSFKSEVGVTTLTEIAATAILNTGATSAEAINLVNEQVRVALAPALTDITVPPQLIDAASGVTASSDQAGIYAVSLAALAQMGSSASSPALAIVDALRADFLDLTIDGKVGDQVFESPLYNASNFISEYTSAIQAYAQQVGLTEDLSTTFSLDNIKKTLEGLSDIFASLDLGSLELDFVPGGLSSGSGGDSDDDDDNDDNNGNDGEGNTLTITGSTTVAGITTEITEIVIKNVPAPDPNDLETIKQQIEDSFVQQQLTVNDLAFELVSSSDTEIVVSVRYSVTTQGVTVTSDLTYTWTLTGKDDDDDDMDDDVMLPEVLKGKVFDMVFKLSDSGSSYADGQKVRFTFSSSGMMFIDTDPDANNGDEMSLDDVMMEGSEYVYKDDDGGFVYKVSVTASGLNEINLFTMENTLLGSFIADGGDAIAGLELVTARAGEYRVVGDGHSRGTVMIGADGAIDFDTGISYAQGDIMAIFDRTNLEEEKRIQINYGADDDGPVINLFLSADGNSITSIQYRIRTDEVDVMVTVEGTVTGGGGG